MITGGAVVSVREMEREEVRAHARPCGRVGPMERRGGRRGPLAGLAAAAQCGEGSRPWRGPERRERERIEPKCHFPICIPISISIK